MKKRLLTIAIIFLGSKAFSQCACCAGANSGNAFNMSATNAIAKKQLYIGGFYEERNVNDIGAIEDDEKLLTKMAITSVVVNYGISNKINIQASLPYIHLYTKNGNDYGFGDAAIIAGYNLQNKKGNGFVIKAGIELPTGVQRQQTKFDEATLVLGSGSYDPIIALSFQHHLKKISLLSSALYKHTTKGFNDNYYGSVATHNANAMYKLNANENCNTSTPFIKQIAVAAFAGYSGQWVGKVKEGEVVDDNTGFYVGFANVGLQASYKNWTLPLEFNLPIINNVNGNQNKAGNWLRIGLIKKLQL